MLPLGLALPFILLLPVALFVAGRDLIRALARRRTGGLGPVVTNAGEVFMILAALAVFQQGRPAGLMLAPAGGYLFFFGGAVLVFVGMTLESLRAQRG